MAAVPGYIKRYARILEALQVLAYYPDGLPLAQLADELAVGVDDLRAEILAYYTAEPASPATTSLPGIAWLSPTGVEDDPWRAEVLVLTDPAALAELGVVRMSTAEMAAVWRAGTIMLEYDQDNEVLRDALRVLAEGWLNGPQATDEPGSDSVVTIRQAIAQRRSLTFHYAREWRPGVSTRTVDPYRLIRTNRGWEFDAGPLDAEGNPRTFLLSNISGLQVLAAEFEVPEHIQQILDRNRAQLSVEVSLPQQRSWAAAAVADHVVTVVGDNDTVTLRVDLSPPYARRLALILAPSMGEGMLMSHRDLSPQVAQVAQQLLAHHGFPLT